MFEKTQPIRSHSMTYGAKDQSCIKCGSKERVVFAHYSGPRQHDYGKGRGVKGHDLIGADFCQGCHDYYDLKGYLKDINKWEASEEFLHYCVLTQVRRYRQGVLKI